MHQPKKERKTEANRERKGERKRQWQEAKPSRAALLGAHRQGEHEQGGVEAKP